MTISFIIPVYKVEQYLSQCVESITSQTYNDMEIILVDDGSPDGCPALCDLLAAKDKRIVVYHKENGGLSDARNFGLLHATGDYVIFLDSDDKWINNDSLEKLVGYLKSDEYDFIQFNCCYWYPNGSYHKWVAYDGSLNHTVSPSTVILKLVSSGTFSMSACFKVINRQFLLDNDLFFKKGIISEDVPWMINLLDKTTKTRFINDYVYAYRQDVAGSITNTLSIKSELDVYNNILNEIEKLSTRSFSEDAKKALMSYNAFQYATLLGSVDYYSRDEQLFLMGNLRNLSYLLDYTYNPKVKIVSVVYRLAGLYITRKVLHIYHKMRQRKLRQ